ncbi:MAG TPA: histidine kinase [Nocardiopsis listeri]|uniref:sensor histidine kinase n=1 Tax=Nocardiopsis listeri TaxID=53440 RepID=UPI001D5B304D|nr:histidine kinase [Nocardiopsis listeri]HJE60961.1 histidine kinase [Nocardiopsis listeri]
MEPDRRSRRDVAVDSLLTVFAVLYGLVGFSGYGGELHPVDRVPDWVLWLDLAFLPLCCAGLWWRRSHPVTVALCVTLVSAFSVSAVGALVVALISLAAYRPFPRAAAVTLLAMVLSLPWVVLISPDPGGAVVILVMIVVMLSACLAWGAAIRSRRSLVERLREDVRRQRQMHEERLTTARVEERRRIAREMHDVIAHRMSLLSVHAGALAYRTERAETGEAAPLEAAEVGSAMRVIRDNAHRVLDELGDILDVLRSGDLVGEDPGEEDGSAPQPRLDDLQRLVREAVEAGERVEFDLDLPENARPREQVQRTAYRVVQEGLTNTRKHAPSARVAVEVTGAPGRGLEVVVCNPLPMGLVAPELPGTGAGLAGLAERVRLDGGRLEHGPGNGRFRLIATLPWPAEGSGEGPGEGSGSAAEEAEAARPGDETENEPRKVT